VRHLREGYRGGGEAAGDPLLPHDDTHVGHRRGSGGRERARLGLFHGAQLLRSLLAQQVRRRPRLKRLVRLLAHGARHGIQPLFYGRVLFIYANVNLTKRSKSSEAGPKMQFL